MAEPLYCYRHPGRETVLRCAKCERPICVKCVVQTPVGARCPECARLQRLPTFTVTPVHYLRALGAAVVGGALLGTAWAFLFPLVAGLFYFLPWLLLVGVGYLVGEAVSLATNRKRGRGLQAVAALGTLAALAVAQAWLPYLVLRDLLGILAFAVAVAVAISRLR